MDRKIEKEFFKAFEFGGVVHMCFEWMQEKYDLCFKLSKEDEATPKKALPDNWQHYYDDILPKQIDEATKAFDDSVICFLDSPLMDEIANNIDSLTGKARERYVFSLLKPFKEFSDNIHPEAIIRELKGEAKGICGIKDFERDLAMWKSMPQDEQLENVKGEPAGTPKGQADACIKLIEEHKYRIERVNYVANRYREIVNESLDNRENGTVEDCFHSFWSIVWKFANRLDALLLERGINLLWYQRESGIYLKSYRCITDVDFYIGSHELARKYIDEALPKLDTQAQVTEKQEYEEKRSKNASQNTPSEPTKRKGRPKGLFKDKMICENVDEVLKKLHSLMNDRQGREAALIITACIKAGIITKPTFTQVTNEFGNIGNVSGYNRYMREKPFSEDEIKAIVDKIKE